jgi:hypothetical protein
MPIKALIADMQGQQSPSPEGKCDVSFLPIALIDKCKPFIIWYHELNGFYCLPDILWHPETRRFIEANPALRRLFKKSTSSRRALKAKEGFILIAALILATEILAIRLAGWATHYPGAGKKAKALLAEYVPSSRARLTERYLYPQINRSRAVLSLLAPPDPTEADQSKKFRQNTKKKMCNYQAGQPKVI